MITTDHLKLNSLSHSNFITSCKHETSMPLFSLVGLVAVGLRFFVLFSRAKKRDSMYLSQTQNLVFKSGQESGRTLTTAFNKIISSLQLNAVVKFRLH